VLLTGLVLLRSSNAEAQSTLSAGAFRFATETAFQGHFPTENCDPATCTFIPSSGGPAYTSDWTLAYQWLMQFAQEGEVVSTSVVAADGTIVQAEILTYHTTSNEPGYAEWVDQYGNILYSLPGYSDKITGASLTCQPPGSWNFQLTDNGVVKYSTPITLSHNSPLPGITSPLDNTDLQDNPQEIALVDLAADQNFTATDGVPFIASSNTGNPINWTATLTYSTSSGTGPISAPPQNFQTASGQPPSPAQSYQSEGGQVKATATTTAGDGSTVQDCVTFYIEGPAGGIAPNSIITQELDQLYPASYSYMAYLNDSSHTPNLMTGVAMHETQYRQFVSPDDNPANSDRYSLYQKYNIAAKLPDENTVTSSSPRGTYIGMMQPQTAPN
jgi:hypothetical protein